MGAPLEKEEQPSLRNPEDALPGDGSATVIEESAPRPAPKQEMEKQNNKKRKRQRMPKKKIHRPKVVKEGVKVKPAKPPLTPKPKTPAPKEKAPDKRKGRKNRDDDTSWEPPKPAVTPKPKTPVAKEKPPVKRKRKNRDETTSCESPKPPATPNPVSPSPEESPVVKRTYERGKGRQGATSCELQKPPDTPKPETPSPNEKPLIKTYGRKKTRLDATSSVENNTFVFTHRKLRIVRSKLRPSSVKNNTFVFTHRKPRTVRRKLSFDLNVTVGGLNSIVDNVENKDGEMPFCSIAPSKDTASNMQCGREFAASPSGMACESKEPEGDPNLAVSNAENKDVEASTCNIAPSQDTASSMEHDQEFAPMFQSPAGMASDLNEPDVGLDLILNNPEKKAGEAPWNIAESVPELALMFQSPLGIACDLKEPEGGRDLILNDSEHNAREAPSCNIACSMDSASSIQCGQECALMFLSPADMACDNSNGLSTVTTAGKQIFRAETLDKKKVHYSVTSGAANVIRNSSIVQGSQPAAKKADSVQFHEAGSENNLSTAYNRIEMADKDPNSKASAVNSNGIWMKPNTKTRKRQAKRMKQNRIWTKLNTKKRKRQAKRMKQNTKQRQEQAKEGHANQTQLEKTSDKYAIMHLRFRESKCPNGQNQSIQIPQVLRSIEQYQITKQLGTSDNLNPLSTAAQFSTIVIATEKPDVRRSRFSNARFSKKDHTAFPVPIQYKSGQNSPSSVVISRTIVTVPPVKAFVQNTIYTSPYGGQKNFIPRSHNPFLLYNASLADDFQGKAWQTFLSIQKNQKFSDFSRSAMPYLLPMPLVPSEHDMVHKEIDLNLHGGQEDMIFQEESALVPYNASGPVVLHQNPSERTKKGRPRAVVDLDEESVLVWYLLMGENEADGVNMDSQKWRQERDVFSGRAKSFIARMRSIQGKREFSRWRGSVVDSVVGVYLTQNVSDQLSSSAFMSLVARFPVQSKDNCERNARNEPMKDDAMANVSLRGYSGTFTGYTDSDFVSKTPASMADILAAVIASLKELGLKENEGSLMEDVISSSNSVEPENTSDSPIYMSTHVVSSSELNCKAEDLLVEGKISNSGPPSCLEFPHNTKVTDIQEASSHDDKSISSGDDSSFSQCKIYPEENNQHEAEIPSQMPECKTDGTYTDSLATQLKLQNLDDAKDVETNPRDEIPSSPKVKHKSAKETPKGKNAKSKTEKTKTIDWESLRKQVHGRHGNKRSQETLDSVDWEAVRNTEINEIAQTIKNRGQHNILAGRIKDFLNQLVKDHGSLDLEWLRDIPPDKAKEYLLGINGLGIKSVECVRLLSLHHHAFPVDTNVGRICVRLGWVPLQPLPESLQLHLLESYPVMDHIQKYLWPRLCTLDQETLYELHYQMITFGKVFCTKRAPNCNACPMRGECKHFASAFASARLPLPGPEEKSSVSSSMPMCSEKGSNPDHHLLPLPELKWNDIYSQKESNVNRHLMHLPQIEGNHSVQRRNSINFCEPIIEEPSTPEREFHQPLESDIEDMFCEDPDEIPVIKLNLKELRENIQSVVQANKVQLEEGHISNALVLLTQEAASIPMQKLKNVSRLRTEHQVYELPDSHPLLEGMGQRERNDPNPYLLVIWTRGARTTESPEICCNSQDTGNLCDEDACVSCNTIREERDQTVRGTLLIPSRTAMQGSFPLNGTYFQCNEVFADHESSYKPINVRREWIWNLHRRTAYFGTSVTSILRGLTMEAIQLCFHRGFVCVRGFDQKTRAPKPLYRGLHFTGSNIIKNKKSADKEE